MHIIILSQLFITRSDGQKIVQHSTTDNSPMHENKFERVRCQMSPAPLERVDQQQVNRAVQSLVQCRTKPITF